jgi:hypothetical protein
MYQANLGRASRAEAAILQYAIAKGEARGLYTDTETIFTDFLADLMHFADREGLDLERCISMAALHYDAEKSGPEEDTA